MKYRLIEKTYDTAAVTAPAETEWLDVGGEGCDSIAYVINVTNASTPDGGAQLQGSLDKTVVVPIGSETAIAADGVFSITQDRPPYRYYRLAYTMDSGSADFSTKVLAKGDKA
jgi:hypothetical protein